MIEAGAVPMLAKIVLIRLNQQQIELVDRTIAKGEAPDRAALIRRALREQAAKVKGAKGDAR
jgi:Arc/MetJ-type ribon-helix-helix transcriptional regulator